MKKKKTLNSRQWWLYNTLGCHAGEWMTEKEICSLCPRSKFGEPYEYKDNAKGSKCSTIWYDMQAINESYQVDKLIITKDRKYKMAESEEELNGEYAEAMREKAVRALIRYSILKRKAKADGQGKLVTLHGDQMTEESKARMFIETYINVETSRNC